jgi:hypothetical protein
VTLIVSSFITKSSGGGKKIIDDFHLANRDAKNNFTHEPITSINASLIFAYATFPIVFISICGKLGISFATTIASTIAGPSAAKASLMAGFKSPGFLAVKPCPPQARASAAKSGLGILNTFLYGHYSNCIAKLFLFRHTPHPSKIGGIKNEA